MKKAIFIFYWIIICQVFSFGQELYSCKILRKIVSSAEFFNLKDLENIYIIDTFNLFTASCSFSVNKRNFFIENNLKTEKKANCFFVSGIATGRANSLCVGFSNISNYQIAFYLLLRGNRVEIIQTTKGYL